MIELLTISEDLGGRQEPLFFVEPTDRGPATELQRQQALVNFLRRHSRCGVFAVPNGGKLSDWDRLRATREGMVSGAPDLVIWWTSGVAFIEMKSGTGRLSKEQVAFGNALIRGEHHYGCFRTADRALGWLRGVGAPVGVRG